MGDRSGSQVALLADLHGNMTAFEAVLAEIDALGVERIAIAGDIAWGIQPAETVAAVMALGGRATVVRGNADREVADPETVEGDRFLRDSTAWCAARLGDSQRTWLRELPSTATVEVDGIGTVLICHGSPRSDIESIRPETSQEEAETWLGPTTERVVVCGHTHVQFERSVTGYLIVNPGSVGLHYGADGAQWALLGTEVELRTTSYDWDLAARLALRSGIPGSDEFARFLREPKG